MAAVKRPIDHTLTHEIVCPYCGHEFSDSYDYGSTALDEDIGKLDCEDCERTFTASRTVSIRYSTEPIRAPGDSEPPPDSKLLPPRPRKHP